MITKCLLQGAKIAKICDSCYQVLLIVKLTVGVKIVPSKETKNRLILTRVRRISLFVERVTFFSSSSSLFFFSLVFCDSSRRTLFLFSARFFGHFFVTFSLYLQNFPFVGKRLTALSRCLIPLSLSLSFSRPLHIRDERTR